MADVVEIIIKTIADDAGSKVTSKSLTDIKSGIEMVVKAYEIVKGVAEDWVNTQSKQAEVSAKVNVILQNQAGAVGANEEQFRKWARAMSETSGVSAITIENAMAMAASFGDLSGKQIPETTQAALDMAAVLGGDVQSNLTMIAGILETGVVPRSLKFSESLKQNIKDAIDAGDKDAALGLILSELEKRYHGAAQAVDEAGDHADDVANAYENLKAASMGARDGAAAYNEMLANGINAEADAVRAKEELRQAEEATGVSATKMVMTGNHLTEVTRELTDAEKWKITAYEKDKAASEDLASIGEKVVAAQKAQTKSAQELSTMYQQQLSMVSSLQSSEEKYQTKGNELTQERIDLERRKALVTKYGWDQERDTLPELNKKLAENAAAVKANEAEHDRASRVIILGYLQQQLAADGLTDKEMNFLLNTGQQWGIYSADVVKQAKDAQKAVNNYTDALNHIPGHITTMLELEMMIGEDLGGRRGTAHGGNYALGGMHIDSFAMGGLAKVGEWGPELVRLPHGSNVLTNGDTQALGGGRGGVNLNVTVSGGVVDPQRTARELKPALRYALRDMGVQVNG